MAVWQGARGRDRISNAVSWSKEGFRGSPAWFRDSLFQALMPERDLEERVGGGQVKGRVGSWRGRPGEPRRAEGLRRSLHDFLPEGIENKMHITKKIRYKNEY